ncbi:Indoleamine 2,3-dioxygenase subfamily [Moelleriella libera RCEF 2490]|uniref:Indoleamine 2,3-dioxygenase subfamily n=1 Tax=Moelleriella libera RCEF 2490 TaxID=1081109 RepID=A0A162IHQ9_9HYPO|nr:Indoleamine 2,3-dioxygenase subfamily [Moelleriella libera RCEF 2490]
MLPPIPALSDYGLSARHGFLPETLPLTRLPDPHYNKWEAIAANLQALVLTRRLRGIVDQLPILSTDGLVHESEWRRAYSLLCFIAHAYIWGGDTPADRLPMPVSVPLIEISEHLEVLPVATYAAVCLWNFKPVFMDEDIDNMENLATLNTFTGSIDESWFYLISVAIEARGAPILDLGLTAMEAARADDAKTVTSCLVGFAERLTDLTNILQRMHDSCDPTIFYHRVRPFLAGSKNMGEAGLPNGVIYEDGSGTEKYREYSGGSNAQSSLIQFFDIVLGIQHRPTGETKDPSSESEREGRHAAPRHNFIQEMRRYMPGPHARFLADVAGVANIRDYVNANLDEQELCLAYDACLAMLSAFRDKHIAIVTRYIITPSREARARSRSRSRKPVNLAAASSKSKSQTGTGGTALIPFLKQARDETGEPAIEEWTKRFMKRKLKAEHQADPLFSKPEKLEVEENVDVKGLAGSWTMDDEVGGICSF